MVRGTYTSLGRAYLQACENCFRYVGYTHWFFKIPILFLSLIYSLFLIPVALFFYALIILDLMSAMVSSMRELLINSMDQLSSTVSRTFFSFLINPILIVCIAPLFLLTLIFPKFSSLENNLNPQNGFIRVENGLGSFKRMNHLSVSTVKGLFKYFRYENIFVKITLLPIAIFYSGILIVIAIIFACLIPLDWISSIIESSRQFILNLSNNMADKILYNGLAFLLSPTTLVILAPIFFVVLIIPKFSSQLDVTS